MTTATGSHCISLSRFRQQISHWLLAPADFHQSARINMSVCLLFLCDYTTVGVGYIIGLGCPFVLIRSVSISENVLWDTPIELRLH